MAHVHLRRFTTVLAAALLVFVGAAFASTVAPTDGAVIVDPTAGESAAGPGVFQDPLVPLRNVPLGEQPDTAARTKTTASVQAGSAAATTPGQSPGNDQSTPPPTGAVAGAVTTTSTTIGGSPPGTTPPPVATTTTTTTTTTTPQPSNSSGMYLWDTAWQVAAKANNDGMAQYVGRLAAASGSGGANVTGFLFSVVNINQDINTPNGFGHTFGSFDNPNPEYLNDVETLIAKAAGQGLRVGIVVAWDGPNQFSVENGGLNAGNAYDYGYRIASQWTRPDFGSRWAVSAWVLGGDTTKDNGGEHGAVWSEVARGINDAEAANGFWGAPILFHTAPGQHFNYLGAGWLDAHSPQTGHCADTGTAVSWMNELAATGARVWGNAEARYEGITWSCNGNAPITADQVLADAKAMGSLGFMDNFVYGHDDRWNSSWPGASGLSAGGGVSAGLQKILDEPGLIRSRG
ncbi:MAG: DUF4038 domain-containing protein [Acidimicrobiia bacterium]|nr:DUF4038 domain-containing protein [Acidimicrobiia bacterium]